MDMNKKIEVKDSPIHGKGVFATRKIRADAKIGVYKGPSTLENDIYVLWVEDDDGKEVGIDGQNELRYVNHSSKPNAVFLGAELFALSEIPPSAEITFDYGEEWSSVD